MTPLEAAARALWESDYSIPWVAVSTWDKQVYQDVARAALTAAIEALPRNPNAPDSIWLEEPGVMSVRYVVSAELLRRALLGEP